MLELKKCLLYLNSNQLWELLKILNFEDKFLSEINN